MPIVVGRCLQCGLYVEVGDVRRRAYNAVASIYLCCNNCGIQHHLSYPDDVDPSFTLYAKKEVVVKKITDQEEIEMQELYGRDMTKRGTAKLNIILDYCVDMFYLLKYKATQSVTNLYRLNLARFIQLNRHEHEKWDLKTVVQNIDTVDDMPSSFLACLNCSKQSLTYKVRNDKLVTCPHCKECAFGMSSIFLRIVLYNGSQADLLM